MAIRRMISKRILMTDKFMKLSLTAFKLYIMLLVTADDDGINDSLTITMLMSGTEEKDLQELLDNDYLIKFNESLVVIKHWKMQNYIKPDRYTPTSYQKEIALLELDNKKEYHLKSMDTDCIQNGNKTEAQYSIGKYSIVKDSEVKSSEVEKSEVKERKEEVRKEKGSMRGKENQNNALPQEDNTKPPLNVCNEEELKKRAKQAIRERNNQND